MVNMLRQSWVLSLIVCIIVNRMNFVVEYLLKNNLIVSRVWSISQAKEEDFENEVSAVVCVYSKARLWVMMGWFLLINTYGYMWWLVKIVSTRCSEIGSRCNEQAWVRNCTLVGWDREHSLQWDWLPLQWVGLDCWLFDIKVCHYSEHESRCSEIFTRCNEWSLPCDNVMYDEMLNCCVDKLMYAWWGLLVITRRCILYMLVH